MSVSSSDDNKEKSTFTISDSSSSYRDNSIPILNNEQILVDWINTIRQPHCLLVNTLSDNDITGNGIVFIEIISNFLKYFGLEELNINENLSKYEKLNLIIMALLELNYGEYFNYEMKQKTLFFYNKINLIFQNKKFLIDFIEFLKELYETYGIDTNNINYNQKNLKKINNNEKKSIDNNENDNDNGEDMNVFQDLDIKNENKLIENRIQNNSINNNITNLNINLMKKNNNNRPKTTHKSFDNTNNQFRQDNRINKIYGNLLSKNNSNQENPNINSEKVILESKKNILYQNIFPSHRLERNKLLNNLNYPSLSPTHNISISISPTNANNISNISNAKLKNLQLIKKRANEGEINLTIGLIKKNTYDNINFNNNINTIFNFLLPSKPIIGISTDINIFEKYIPKVNKNIKLKNESIFQPEPIITNLIKKEKNNFKKSLNDSQILIKKWLFSIKLIPRNCTFDYILNLCYNGNLFCEIMNRYNSSKGNTIIKGIINSPFTVSQIEMNLKKFFKSINNKSKLYSKFKNYEQLIDELINKNENVAINILNELYIFYNKNTQKYIQTEKIKKPIKLNIEKNKEEEYFPLSNRQNKSMHNILNLNNSPTFNRNSHNNNTINTNSIINKNNNNESNINNEFLYSRNYSQDFKKIDLYLKQDDDNNQNDSLNHFFDVATLNNDYIKNNHSYIFNNLMKRNNNLLSKHSQINLKKGFFFNKSYKSQNNLNRKINSQSYNYNKIIPSKSPKCFLLFNGSNLNMMKDETKKFLKY